MDGTGHNFFKFLIWINEYIRSVLIHTARKTDTNYLLVFASFWSASPSLSSPYPYQQLFGVSTFP